MRRILLKLRRRGDLEWSKEKYDGVYKVGVVKRGVRRHRNRYQEGTEKLVLRSLDEVESDHLFKRRHHLPRYRDGRLLLPPAPARSGTRSRGAHARRSTTPLRR